MQAKFDNLEYKNIDALIAGFITGTQKGKQKFHLIASPNIQYMTAMQIIQSVTTHFLTALMKQYPDAKDDIFDHYNAMASSVLNNIMPGYERRPDMDEEAIMETERRMIEEAYAKMTPEEKEKALKDIEEMKARLIGGANDKPAKDNKKV